ncbi:hypothetical protein BH23VER1_BH23VER1_12940 [soil metagenome]
MKTKARSSSNPGSRKPKGGSRSPAKRATPKAPRYTIGVDPGGKHSETGDRRHAVCVLDRAGEIAAELTVANDRESLAELAAGYPGARAVIEVWRRSPWSSRQLAKRGPRGRGSRPAQGAGDLPERASSAKATAARPQGRGACWRASGAPTRGCCTPSSAWASASSATCSASSCATTWCASESISCEPSLREGADAPPDSRSPGRPPVTPKSPQGDFPLPSPSGGGRDLPRTGGAQPAEKGMLPVENPAAQSPAASALGTLAYNGWRPERSRAGERTSGRMGLWNPDIVV